MTGNNVSRTRSQSPRRIEATGRQGSVPARATVSAIRTKTLALLSLLLLFSLPGCNVCRNVQRTMRHEPDKFNWWTDSENSVETYRVWADRVWREQCSANPESQHPCSYRDGFKDGFVDYVYAGGNGQPPPVAPREYWNVEARNPNGHQAADEWFAGFRHGAQVARHEGYRERTTLRSSDLLFGPKATSCSAKPLCRSQSRPAPLIAFPQSEVVEPGLPSPTPAVDPTPTPKSSPESSPKNTEELPPFQLNTPSGEQLLEPVQKSEPVWNDNVHLRPTRSNDLQDLLGTLSTQDENRSRPESLSLRASAPIVLTLPVTTLQETAPQVATPQVATRKVASRKVATRKVATRKVAPVREPRISLPERPRVDPLSTSANVSTAKKRVPQLISTNHEETVSKPNMPRNPFPKVSKPASPSPKESLPRNPFRSEKNT